MHGAEGFDPALAALAAECGVLTRYADMYGVDRDPPPEAVLAVLRALGVPVERTADAREALRAFRAGRPPADPVRIAWNGAITHVAGPAPGGTGVARVRIRFEDGSEQHADLKPDQGAGKGRFRYAIPGPLPLGIHDVELETGGTRCATRILAAPRAAWLPPRPRSWGVFLPLHGCGPAGTSLPGTYTDLRALLGWVGRTGGAYVGTLPVLPTFLDRPFEPSPYAPVSRLFLSELFVDPARAQAAVRERVPIGEVRYEDPVAEVDYRAAWQRLRGVLGPLADRFFGAGGARDPRFLRFLQMRPGAENYARFRAAATRQARPWREWPDRLAGGRLERGDFDAAEYRFHLFAAWCAEEQMAAAISDEGAARPYLDLPLGVHPDGYDTWRHRHLFAEGVTAGAPPDTFFERGQNWGFPPLAPEAARADGYRYLLDCLRLQLRFAGALRLDHVMALERLFWVPAGFDAADGVYVRYPREEMLALLTLESQRYGAMIVGEDLGTVTDSIRTALETHAVQRMFVVQFEIDPGREVPLPTPGADEVASVNTHDLPAFAAWLRGLDLEERESLGLLESDTARAMRRHREHAVRSLCRSLGVPEDPPAPRATLEALVDALARSPARLVIINLEDIWLETRQQNVPGTTAERPNWCCRSPFDAASLERDPQVAALLTLVNRARSEPDPVPTGKP